MPVFETPDLPPRTAVVAHDAGAANIIRAWLEAGLVFAARVYVEGPARTAWPVGLGPIATSLHHAIVGVDAVLSGTGWASDLEHRARVLARQNGTLSVAVVDHWVNYAARFEHGGRRVLPDQVWVTDDEAYAIACRELPGVTIRQMPNLYLDREVARIKGSCVPRSGLLYVAEPMRNDWGRGRPGEFQALDYLADRWHTLPLRAGAELILRPHPSEPQGKYDAWIARPRHFKARLDACADLWATMSRAEVVAGCSSFALVIALEAGIPVYCSLPPWAPPCALPHRGIVKLEDLG